MCTHLQWIKKENRKMYNLYKDVQGFSSCSNALNPKFRWQKEDPKEGVDFYVWKQESVEVSGESECSSKGGVYRKYMQREGGKCYTYWVLERICLLIAYVEHAETASYSWEYKGGCYANGDIGVYQKASSGTDYLFDFVPIEVRWDESVYSSLSNAGNRVGAGSSPVFHGLGLIFLILAVISGILFVVFYFKAKSGFSFGPSGSVQHQLYEDDKSL